MRTHGERSPTLDIRRFVGFPEQRDENSQSLNSQRESGPCRVKVHVGEDPSLWKYDTPKDGKNYALKLPKPELLK